MTVVDCVLTAAVPMMGNSAMFDEEGASKTKVQLITTKQTVVISKKITYALIRTLQ